MNISAELLAIVLGALQGLIIVVGWFIKRTLSGLEEMADETLGKCREINGSVRELKVWTIAHEKLDDERSERAKETHKEIWKKLEDR